MDCTSGFIYGTLLIVFIVAWSERAMIYKFQFIVQTSGAQIVLSLVIYKVIYRL